MVVTLSTVIVTCMIVGGIPKTASQPADEFPAMTTNSATEILEELQEKKQACKENEVWTTCGNFCPPICAQVKSKNVPFCSLRCAARCQCKEGYVYNDKHECISMDDCLSS